jgi:hypothetical protein
MTNATSAPVQRITEKAWQQTVIDAAKALKYRVYHTFDSRKSAPGFPDLCLIRGERLIFAELKAEKGKLSEAQVDWLNDLGLVETVEVYIWRPSDWPNVELILKGEAA